MRCVWLMLIIQVKLRSAGIIDGRDVVGWDGRSEVRCLPIAAVDDDELK